MLCQETTKPRGQQPILRFAPAEAAIEARPPCVFYHGRGNDTNSRPQGHATLPMPFAELPRRIGKVDPFRRPRNINPNTFAPAQAGTQPTAPQRATSAVPRAYLGPGLRRGDGLELGIV